MGIFHTLSRKKSLNLIVHIKSLVALIERFEDYTKMIPDFLGHLNIGKIEGKSPKRYFKKEILDVLVLTKRLRGRCKDYDEEIGSGDAHIISLKHLGDKGDINELVTQAKENFVAIMMMIKEESEEGEAQIAIRDLTNNALAIFRDIEKELQVISTEAGIPEHKPVRV